MLGIVAGLHVVVEILLTVKVTLELVGMISKRDR